MLKKGSAAEEEMWEGERGMEGEPLCSYKDARILSRG
jgi:hypothetical protein